VIIDWIAYRRCHEKLVAKSEGYQGQCEALVRSEWEKPLLNLKQPLQVSLSSLSAGRLLLSCSLPLTPFISKGPQVLEWALSSHSKTF